MYKNVAVVEQQQSNYRDIADLVYVSNSFIRHEIRRLGERLNTRLLNRSTRTVQLTDMSRIYYDRARETHNRIETLESEMSFYRDC